jgi:uncharacterized protein (DUF433 family)
VDYGKRATMDPFMRGRKPCIRGIRITVYGVLGYLASGMSQEEILPDFPHPEAEEILASLAFAADFERRFAAEPSP